MAKDPYRFFRVEARELLDQMGSGLLGLESRAATGADMAKLLRQAHTLKGAARVVRQSEIADHAHAIEDLLAPWREGGQALPHETVDALLAELDAISRALGHLPAPEAASDTAPAPAGVKLLRTDQAELGELLNGLGEIGRELAALDELAALLTDCREQADAGRLPTRRRKGSQRLLSKQLEAAQSRLGLASERIARELRQARETADRLRLIPAAALFPALERCCRDAAQSLNLEAGLETLGGELLLDGQVLDLLQGALVQLVRNAVAHGIEPPEQRRAAGKPERGRIELQVLRRGQRIAFRCRDDGRGVDFAAVRRARPQGAAGAPEPDQEALLRQLFRGGLSTAASLSQIAGRGIGLDLVREVVSRLGGELLAHSEAGLGTTVELLVPVSMSLFDALLVELNGQTLALPLAAVQSSVRVQPEQLLLEGDSAALRHGEQLLPLVDPALRGAGQQGRTAVLLTVEGRQSALLVDRVRGIESILLRPLPALCLADALVLGCFLDLAGNPVVVLDPAVLVQRQGRRAAPGVQSEAPIHPILVVDDSLTTRMLEQSILEAAGLPVETAASAEEALELARRKPYALFLVDVEMPGMDGFAFVEHTRADPRLQQVPCIMVTSCDSAEYRARGRDAGASAYLIKSQFDQIEFLQHVDRLLSRQEALA